MKKLIPAKEVVSKLKKSLEDIPVELLASFYEDSIVDSIEDYTKRGINALIIDVLWDDEIEKYYYGEYILPYKVRKELREKYNISKEVQISAYLKITRKMEDLGYNIKYIGGDMNQMVIRW